MKKYILTLAVLLVSLLIFGCTATDPVIGCWKYSAPSGAETYLAFNSDGSFSQTTQGSFFGNDEGTWTSIDSKTIGVQYVDFFKGETAVIVIYDETSKTIYLRDFPEAQFGQAICPTKSSAAEAGAEVAESKQYWANAR